MQTLLCPCCVHAVRKLHGRSPQSIPPLQDQEGSQQTLQADERKGNNDHRTLRNEKERGGIRLDRTTR